MLPDMAMIAGAVSSLKTAGEIAKGMLSLRDTAMIQSKVMELQGVILSAQQSALAAQSEQFTLLERIRNLEKQVADFQAWDHEKQRYRLKDFGSGQFAYTLRPEASNGEPIHYICSTCYNGGHKSILQLVTRGRTQELYRCLHCNFTFNLAPT